jgi:hypothetical protein
VSSPPDRFAGNRRLEGSTPETQISEGVYLKARRPPYPPKLAGKAEVMARPDLNIGSPTRYSQSCLRGIYRHAMYAKRLIRV